MKTLLNGRDVILKYCSQFTEDDARHIWNCLDVVNHLELGKLDMLKHCGCPDRFGLENFVGDCDLGTGDDCDKCWQRALSTTIEDKRHQTERRE